jgi:hypothetical protein
MRNVIETRIVRNLQQLKDVLDTFTVTSEPGTVYLESSKGDQTFALHLVETTLTDGSIVYSVIIRPAVQA